MTQQSGDVYPQMKEYGGAERLRQSLATKFVTGQSGVVGIQALPAHQLVKLTVLPRWY